jgi:hypothetical protein
LFNQLSSQFEGKAINYCLTLVPYHSYIFLMAVLLQLSRLLTPTMPTIPPFHSST